MDLMTAMLASKLAGLNPSGGGGGGVTDYNKLENKPVGETVVHSDTLEWDGNTDGLVSDGVCLFKVSDAVPTKEDCANGLTVTFAGQTMPLSGEEVQAMFSDDGLFLFDAVCFVPSDNYVAGDDLVFPEAGVYFPSLDGMVTTELIIPGYTFTKTEIKKLDMKFLPDPVLLYGDDDNYLYKSPFDGDTSKRITNRELRDIFFSASKVFVRHDTYDTDGNATASSYFAVLGYANSGLYGATLRYNGVPEFFTAEYTPG